MAQALLAQVVAVPRHRVSSLHGPTMAPRNAAQPGCCPWRWRVLRKLSPCHCPWRWRALRKLSPCHGADMHNVQTCSAIGPTMAPDYSHVCVIDPQNASAMSGSSTPSSPLVDAMASGGLPVRVSDRSLRQNLCRTGVPCLGTHIGEGGRRAVNGAWLSGTRLVCDWMGIAPVRTFSTGFPILHMSSYFTPPWR